MRIFLCGDVMLGRGVDQALPWPCGPELHERYMSSALDYMRLAELKNGSISPPLNLAAVWGAALDEFERRRPDVRLINLETRITRSNNYLPKGINYRMSPENARCLAAAHIDCCVLANNHVLDWGRRGLIDTVATLKGMGIQSAGAARNTRQAVRPAIVDCKGRGRLVVYSLASITSGVPPDWEATADNAGVNLLPDLSKATAERLGAHIAQECRPDDIVITSIHWGANWGYEIPSEQCEFARALVDCAPVSIVHGHSSHHAKAIEVYRGRLILYGCGDFLNDYEGIGGREEFRGDLVVMYFADVDGLSKSLLALEMVPLNIRQLQLHVASAADAEWLVRRLDRECRHFGAQVRQRNGSMHLLVGAIRN